MCISQFARCKFCMVISISHTDSQELWEFPLDTPSSITVERRNSDRNLHNWPRTISTCYYLNRCRTVPCTACRSFHWNLNKCHPGTPSSKRASAHLHRAENSYYSTWCTEMHLSCTLDKDTHKACIWNRLHLHSSHWGMLVNRGSHLWVAWKKIYFVWRNMKCNLREIRCKRRNC
jgi:hypothetical protein